jgi:UDP-N-acetyl-2-amino-2-deoxyglucuronate dehydrogenase
VLSASSYYYESMRTNLTSGTSEVDGGLGWRCSLEKAGGGIVLDGGLHWIRPLRELCGNVERVVGVTRKNTQSGLEMEGETLAHAILQMKPTELGPDCLIQPLNSGPLIATLSCNMLHKAPMAHSMCPFFRITGSDGEIVIPGTGLDPNGGGGLKLFNDSYPYGKDFFDADRQGAFYLGFRAMWKEIARILRENDRIAAAKSVSEAIQDVAVALAIYESSTNGTWVTVSKD